MLVGEKKKYAYAKSYLEYQISPEEIEKKNISKALLQEKIIFERHSAGKKNNFERHSPGKKKF